jgi:hypothetical protein
MASAQPALSELKSSPERTRLAAICVALTQAVLLVSGLFASIIIATNRGFVGWWVGAHEFAGGKVVFLLTACMILNQWWVATTYTIFSFGYERRISITTVLNGFITLGATIVCTRYLGIAGAPSPRFSASLSWPCRPTFLRSHARPKARWERSS